MNSDTFFVDINVTSLCNLACKYCFVGGTGEIFSDSSRACDFINRLIQSRFFLDNYKMLCVNFWGGEPTLRPQFIKDIIAAFDDIGCIRFFIFSNGTKLEGIQDLLLKYRYKKTENHPKLVLQVSYDGEPIHSKFRGQTELVWKTLSWLDAHDVPFTIKSTVPYGGFKYMYDAYLDIKKIGSEMMGKGFKNLDYFPTIEHYNSSDCLFEDYERDLEKALIKIAKKELVDKTNMFKWFTNSRAVCTAGKDLIAIDCDGKIYPCHGCLYEDKKEHVLGDIDNHNVFDALADFRKRISQHLAIESCPNCQVSFCLRCNHAKYSYSEKDQYFSKWCDGTAQPDICRFYNINNRVKLAFEELRRRN